MSRAPHERSIGAQMERKALRAYLRRVIHGFNVTGEGDPDTLEMILAWVLSRQKRYDKKRGGLGR